MIKAFRLIYLFYLFLACIQGLEQKFN